MKGYRTILVGLALAVMPSALTYLAGVDWNSLIGTSGAFIVSGILMTAMRFFTSTPPGVKAP